MADCFNNCITSLRGHDSEFGRLDYGPMSLSEIRQRQEWSESQPHSLLNGQAGAASSTTVQIAYLSQRGYYPEDVDKNNQDAFKIIRDLDSKAGSLMVGVFDGHGEYGDDCSCFVRDNIEASLADALRKHGRGDPSAAFSTCYHHLNSEMHASEDFSDQLSGTTSVVALFDDNAVWVANVGDSRAIVGQLIDGTLKPTALTNDNTPFDKEERMRIYELGGEIASVGQRQKKEVVADAFWDTCDHDRDLAQAFPQPRVWGVGRAEPGCAFTRSLGDAVGEALGVIAEPVVTHKERLPQDRFVLLASDGVWEFLSNEDVCAIVEENLGDPLAACRAVVAAAYWHWMKYDKRRTDDITVILVILEVSMSSGAEAVGSGAVSEVNRGVEQPRTDAASPMGARPVRRSEPETDVSGAFEGKTSFRPSTSFTKGTFTKGRAAEQEAPSAPPEAKAILTDVDAPEVAGLPQSGTVVISPVISPVESATSPGSEKRREGRRFRSSGRGWKLWR